MCSGCFLVFWQSVCWTPFHTNSLLFSLFVYHTVQAELRDVQTDSEALVSRLCRRSRLQSGVHTQNRQTLCHGLWKSKNPFFLLCWILLQNKTLNAFCLSSQNAVIVALSSKSWDVETATELLLSNWILTPSSSSSWSLSLPPHPYIHTLSPLKASFSPVAPSVSHWTPHLHATLLLQSPLPHLSPLCGISPPFSSPLLYHTPISCSASSCLQFL